MNEQNTGDYDLNQNRPDYDRRPDNELRPTWAPNPNQQPQTIPFGLPPSYPNELPSDYVEVPPHYAEPSRPIEQESYPIVETPKTKGDKIKVGAEKYPWDDPAFTVGTEFQVYPNSNESMGGLKKRMKSAVSAANRKHREWIPDEFHSKKVKGVEIQVQTTRQTRRFRLKEAEGCIRVLRVEV